MSSVCSPQTQHFPPGEADWQPDREMRQRDDEPDPPPRRLRHVARAEHDRRRPGAVVRQRGVDVRHHPERDPGHERGRPEHERRREERRKHRRHVRDEGRKRVVRVEIHGQHQHERPPPRPALHHPGKRLREDLRESGLFELSREHHQSAEPHEDVPAAPLVDDVAPVEHADDEQQRHARQGRGRRRDREPVAADPEREHDGEHDQHAALADRQRPHAGQPLGGERARGGGVEVDRRRETIDEIGDGRERDDSGNGRRHRPRRPRQARAGSLADEFGDERVRGARRQEHRRDHEIAVIERQEQEAADARGRRTRLRPEHPRDVQRDGKEDSAGARGVGGRHRRHREVGEHDRIPEPERTASQALHDAVGDALAQARHHQAPREQERGENQPHRDVGVARQALLNREQPQQRTRGDRRDHQRARRNRPRDQPADGGREQAQESPAARVEASMGRQPDGGGDEQRDDPPPARAHVGVLCYPLDVMPHPAFAAALSDRYRLQRELGSGGMATVYLARDVRHDRDVAVKVLKESVAALIGVERFLAEIRTTARLKHPHILPLFDSGSADGVLYYVMPCVDGESLRQRLRRAGPLPIDDATRTLRQVADALAHAHAHGVIHRDVKVDNVLMADGQAFLADFGIARVFAPQDPGATITRTGVAVGTPNYMAPEQLVGGTVDQRTDIYAFGALAYELLTGAPPFDGTLQEVAEAHLTRRPAPLASRRPDAPAWLVSLVDRCLEKEPASRPARAGDLVRALDAAAAPASAVSPSRRTAIAVAIIAAAGALAALAAMTWRGNRPPAETTPALSVGRLTRVTADPGLELDPSISPDGRMIAYAAGPPGHMRVFVKELTGTRTVPLAEGNAADSQRWPQWSPDGARIVFEAGRPSVVSLRMLTAGLGSLFVGTPLGGSVRKLAVRVNDGLASSPSWSPDGSEIAFGTGHALYAMAVDGLTPPRQLAAGHDLHSPRWSPDGKTIAYVSAGSVFTFGADNLGNVGNSTLMALPLATGKSVKITDGNALDTNPVWLPDGRTLLFVSSRGGGRDVYAVPVRPDGTPERAPDRLTSGAGAHGIAVSR